MSIGLVIGIVFIVLKVMDHLEWSWIWVLAPIWIEWCIIILISVFWFGGLASLAGLIGWFSSKRKKQKNRSRTRGW